MNSQLERPLRRLPLLSSGHCLVCKRPVAPGDGWLLRITYAQALRLGYDYERFCADCAEAEEVDGGDSRLKGEKMKRISVTLGD